VALHQVEKIARREPGERGLGEMGVTRDEAIRRGVPVGEIAATAAGDEDFAPDLRVVLQQDDAPAPRPLFLAPSTYILAERRAMLAWNDPQGSDCDR
jgi:hypothetical protein